MASLALPFQRLDTRHLVRAESALPGSPACWSLVIRGTDIGNPLIALFGRLVGGGCQPVPDQVRLEIGFFFARMMFGSEA